MKLLNENLKTAGIINTITIGFVIFLRLSLFNQYSMLNKIETIICCIALLYGVYYSLGGYKKNAASYYKAFMVMYLISSIFSLISNIEKLIQENILGFNLKTIIGFSSVLIIICLFVLSFVKDLKKTKSTIISYLLLIINVVKLVFSLIYSNSIIYIASDVSNLLLAIILCVFVSVKYIDKENRGTE